MIWPMSLQLSLKKKFFFHFHEFFFWEKNKEINFANTSQNLQEMQIRETSSLQARKSLPKSWLSIILNNLWFESFEFCRNIRNFELVKGQAAPTDFAPIKIENSGIRFDSGKFLLRLQFFSIQSASSVSTLENVVSFIDGNRSIA